MAKALPIAAMLLMVVGCKGDKSATEPGTPAQDSKPQLAKLDIKDTKVGDGKTAETGDMIWVLYTGKLANGTVFDTTEKRQNKPFVLTLGAGEVIKGWDQGLVGMKVGGKRTIGIPYELGYGEAGNPPTIPAKSDLYFDVELLDLVKEDEADLIERETVKEGTGPEAKKGDTVSVRYILRDVSKTIKDKKFANEPYTFEIGGGKVREFFDLAVEGMRKGEKRKVRVPPDVGFGPMGGPNIEANEILYYEIDMVNIK